MAVIANKYTILKELGEGGYGGVYLVQHVDIPVRYALKVLNKALSEDSRFIERFKREAEILLRFSHPGSVQLRDFGKTEHGRYYMAMDFSEGTPLQEVLAKNGPFPIVEAMELMEQILAVLGAAHRMNIVHRDIKPDNIMLEVDPSGKRHIKILDFGIAKIKEEALTETKSVEGASIGTPQYMSPEQAAGERILDHRMDIYSTGILFYELISGDLPFNGDTVIQTLLMHLTRPPKPLNPALGIPEYVSSMIYKALQKDRSNRYQSAEDFLDDIKKARTKYEQEQHGESAPVATPVQVIVDPTPAPVVANGSSAPKTKILCLDDNEMILNIMKHLLEKEGYEVFTASDCSAIHGYIFSKGAALLISDVQMPGLPGTRVCQMLKSTVANLKIVLFSNLPERELEKLSKESKADDFISKNARPDEWINKIRTVLAREHTT